MNAYFFNVSNEERSQILNKHKEIYDGYMTQYGKGNNQEPLYIQDYANDKGGISLRFPTVKVVHGKKRTV